METVMICTVVDEQYAHYAPLFDYCAHRAYPDAEIEVLYSNRAEPKYRAACSRYLIDFSKKFDPELGERAPTRFYITDVDMLLLPELVGLVEFHEAEMVESGLPYSNSHRSVQEERGLERMTGLHYCNRKWYADTIYEREAIMLEMAEGKIGSNRIDDELILMRLCRKFGDLPPKRPLLNRHHGVHLGTVRNNRDKTEREIFAQLQTRVTEHFAQEWLKLEKEPDFKHNLMIASRMNKSVLFEIECITRYSRRIAHD